MMMQEENKTTLRALEALVHKQDGVDEEIYLIKSLSYVIYKKILNMSQFNVEMQKKKQMEADKKNQFKGIKCELKPTSMDIHVTMKDLQLSQNYFDKSKQIIAEQQKQL